MAQYPDINGGARVDDAFLSAMIDNYVVKAADSTPRTVATLTSDPDLTFPAEANALYDVTIRVRFGALQAAGIRIGWGVPSGTSGSRECGGPGTANAVQTAGDTTEMKWTIIPYGNAVLYTDPRNAVASPTWLEEHSLLAIGSTAGNVTVQWGQATANATGTVVLASSYVKYRRIG